MENSPKKNSFQSSFLYLKNQDFENDLKKDLYSPKATNAQMIDQLTVPPAHVWDKIEQILDEQDERRRRANTIITSSFKNKARRSKIYLFTLGGLSVIAGLIWVIK